MPVPAGLPDSFYCTEKIDFSKPLDTKVLQAKSVIVTGGANGLGEGCVKAFAEAGAYVTILDINTEKGVELAKGLTAQGHHVQAVEADMTSFTSQTAGFKTALAFSPTNTIDIVVANAGVAGGIPLNDWLIEATSSPDAEPTPPSTAALDVNLTGLFYTSHLALFYFKQTAKSGETASKQLILVSSLAGYLSLSNLAPYNASKYGVRGFWRAIRHSTEILGEGMPPFRTNLIAPTFIKTAMTRGGEAGLVKSGIELGSVEDVAAGVMRVACDESVYARTVAIAPGKDAPGDRNWDLCDDFEGLDGGKELLHGLTDGRIKGLELVGMPATGFRNTV